MSTIKAHLIVFLNKMTILYAICKQQFAILGKNDYFLRMLMQATVCNSKNQEVKMKNILSLSLCLTAAMLFTACASSAQKASSKGFETVTTPATELESLKQDMESKDIPCGIGIGISTDEMVARSQSADEARTKIAESMKTLVERYKEQYAKNVNGDAQKLWEEKANELTQQELSGSTIYKTITQFNDSLKQYKVYSLMVMNPELFKKAIEAANQSQKEFELRAESADMQARMDKAVAAYKEKFTK